MKVKYFSYGGPLLDFCSVESWCCSGSINAYKEKFLKTGGLYIGIYEEMQKTNYRFKYHPSIQGTLPINFCPFCGDKIEIEEIKIGM